MCVCVFGWLSPGTDKSRPEIEAIDSIQVCLLDPETHFYEFITTGLVSGATHTHSQPIHILSGPVK